MGELKVYHCNEWHNEYTEFYLKSEVDKVIAEKDAEIKRMKKMRNMDEAAFLLRRSNCLRIRKKPQTETCAVAFEGYGSFERSGLLDLPRRKQLCDCRLQR